MSFSQNERKGGASLTALVQGHDSRPDEVRNARVSVRPSGDPTDEVRTTLAQLTARAQKLVADNADQRVICNGRRLCEVSRKQAEDSRKLAKRATAGDIFGGSQGSVELFMSRYLNLDIREQQRLLYQLQATQNQIACDLGGTRTSTTCREPLSNTINSIACSNGGVMTGNDVDLFLEGLKNSVISQTQVALHQRVREQVLKQENTLFKAAWKPYYMNLADEAESLMTRSGDHTNLILSLKKKTPPASPEAAPGGNSASALSQLLGGQSIVAEAINRKIAAFANIVERYPHTQWIMRFSAYVHDQSSCSRNDELSLLYATVERIFEPIQRNGPGAGILSCVAASQHVMEQKALTRFFTTAMRIDPSRTDELSNMLAARVLEMIARQSGTSDAWVHIFDAMRMGRYDVAVEASRRIGNKCLESALRRLAGAMPLDRHRLPLMLDLRDLYAETQTVENAHRRAVLFLLLHGSTAESHETTQRVLLQLCTKVAQSLEDVLWMRLFSIREFEPSAKVLQVQTLSFTQKIILDDLHDLVSMTHGDTVRVASFLLHALLPASGLRLLLESDATMYVDGFHLALCLNNCDMLCCSPHETPLDLAKHLQRYCSLVLLDANHGRFGSEESSLPGVATFSYFHKTGFDEAFTEFCARDAIAAQLFGPFHTFSGQGGVLLGAHPSPPSEALLQAMGKVAELSASRANAPLAVHLRLVQAHSARAGGSLAMARAALRRAVQLLCPAMAQALHRSPREAAVAALFVQSNQLRGVLRNETVQEELNDTAHDATLSAVDLQSFEVLCTMADVYQAEANGYLEQALSIFFTLPFIPKSALHEIDRCVQGLCGATIDIVTAAVAVLPLTFRIANALLQAYAYQSDVGSSNSEVIGCVGIPNVVGRFFPSTTDLPSVSVNSQKAYQIVQAMKLVVEWVRRCRSHSSNGAMVYGACTKQVTDFEQQYLA